MLGRAVVAQGNPAKVVEAVVFVRDRVQPLVEAQPGSHGLSMFVNRENGTVVVNTVWADEDALDASDAELASVRKETVDLLEASDPEIHVLEPAVIFQNGPDQPGFWARAIEIRNAPERMDAAIERFRDVLLPAMRDRFAGLNTVALLVDRRSGFAVVNVTYTSREALEASRADGERMRSDALRDVGAELLRIHEMEVAIVGIRPPVDLPAQGQPVQFPSSTRR